MQHSYLWLYWKIRLERPTTKINPNFLLHVDTILKVLCRKCWTLNKKKPHAHKQGPFTISVYNIYTTPLSKMYNFLMGLIDYLPQILINHRVSYVNSYCSTAERNDTLQCKSGCYGNFILASNCTRNSSLENWADFEGVTTFNITNKTSTTLELMFVFI